MQMPRVPAARAPAHDIALPTRDNLIACQVVLNMPSSRPAAATTELPKAACHTTAAQEYQDKQTSAAYSAIMQARAAPLLLVVLLLTSANVFPARAGTECRLALALGLDVSRSVSDAAYTLQIEGVQAALADDTMRSAILAPERHVALAIYEWSGRGEQKVVVGWTLLRSEADIDAVIAELGAAERSFNGITAVGRALFFGARLLLGAPECAARTLDLSGDGRNNDGPDPARIYARFNFGDITVNGLAIGGLEHGILDYYQSEVIRGSGAFVEYAQDWRDFPPVFRRKLLRELTAGLFAAVGSGRATRR